MHELTIEEAAAIERKAWKALVSMDEERLREGRPRVTMGELDFLKEYLKVEHPHGSTSLSALVEDYKKHVKGRVNTSPGPTGLSL